MGKETSCCNAFAEGLVVAHVASRIQRATASGDKTRAAAIIHRVDTLPFTQGPSVLHVEFDNMHCIL